MSLLQLAHAISGYWDQEKDRAEIASREIWESTRWEAWRICNTLNGNKYRTMKEMIVFPWEKSVAEDLSFEPYREKINRFPDTWPQ